jgi:hypothetical protein
VRALALLALVACSASQPDANAIEGVVGKVMGCQAEARDADAKCKADAAPPVQQSDPPECQRAATAAYAACKRREGLSQ